MHLLLTTFLLISIFSNNLIAQNSNSGDAYFPDLRIPIKWYKERLKANDVTALEVQFNYAKGDKVKDDGVSWYWIDSNANLLHMEDVNRKGKLTRDVYFTYDSSNQVVEICNLDDNQDTIFRRTQSYNVAGYFTGFKAYDKTGRLSYERIIQYASDTLMTSYRDFKKGKAKNYYEYAYYPNRERSETKLIKPNGKVKRVWSYACNEEGIQLKSKRDSAKICVKKEVDAEGNKTEVWQWTDDQGKLRKTVEVRNATNKVVSFKDYIGLEEEKRYTNSITYRSDTIMETYTYQRFKKGKLDWDVQKTYNEEGQILQDNSVRYRKGKIIAKWQAKFTFDQQGLVTQYISESNRKNGYSYSRNVKYINP